MKFLRHNATDQEWRTYSQYLESIASQLPKAAAEFALAKWHYDASDHRCPHDAWLEKFTVTEGSQGSSHELRHLGINVLLIGSFQDGFLSLEYERVHRFSMGAATKSGFGDWLIDEIRLAEDGRHVIHEVLFANQAEYLVECEELRCLWSPFAKSPQ